MLKLAISKNHIQVKPEQLSELANLTDGYFHSYSATLDQI
jgi:hypothetical protein